jgi:cytochrome P450
MLSTACCSGAAWRTLRTAWQPAFGSAALEGYAGGMNKAAEELAQRLHSVAASGEEVELFGWVGFLHCGWCMQILVCLLQ